MIKATQTASVVKEDCILEDSTGTVVEDKGYPDLHRPVTVFWSHSRFNYGLFFYCACACVLHTFGEKKDASTVVHTSTISLRSYIWWHRIWEAGKQNYTTPNPTFPAVIIVETLGGGGRPECRGLIWLVNYVAMSLGVVVNPKSFVLQ